MPGIDSAQVFLRQGCGLGLHQLGGTLALGHPSPGHSLQHLLPGCESLLGVLGPCDLLNGARTLLAKGKRGKEEEEFRWDILHLRKTQRGQSTVLRVH